MQWLYYICRMQWMCIACCEPPFLNNAPTWPVSPPHQLQLCKACPTSRISAAGLVPDPCVFVTCRKDCTDEVLRARWYRSQPCKNRCQNRCQKRFQVQGRAVEAQLLAEPRSLIMHSLAEPALSEHRFHYALYASCFSGSVSVSPSFFLSDHSFNNLAGRLTTLEGTVLRLCFWMSWPCLTDDSFGRRS